MSNTKSFVFLFFLFLCSPLVFLFSFSSSYAITSEVREEITLSCNKGENTYYTVFREEEKKTGDFSDAFEKMKDSYHKDMNETFNLSIKTLSESVYTNGGSNVKVCTPVHYKYDSLRDFYKEVKGKHNEYKCALSSISTQNISYKNVQTIDEAKRMMRSQEYVILDEEEKSDMALLIALQTYSEMRQWYPVHRDLECLVSDMTTYRNALRGFIDLVITMPQKFYNYGSYSQHD